jgi:hypothetical protein
MSPRAAAALGAIDGGNTPAGGCVTHPRAAAAPAVQSVGGGRGRGAAALLA